MYDAVTVVAASPFVVGEACPPSVATLILSPFIDVGRKNGNVVVLSCATTTELGSRNDPSSLKSWLVRSPPPSPRLYIDVLSSAFAMVDVVVNTAPPYTIDIKKSLRSDASLFSLDNCNCFLTCRVACCVVDIGEIINDDTHDTTPAKNSIGEIIIIELRRRSILAVAKMMFLFWF